MNNELKYDFHKEVVRDLTDYVASKYPKTKSGIVPFPIVNQRFGTKWHLTKKESKNLLKDLERLNSIQIIAFHGLKII